MADQMATNYLISIHAPTRGATLSSAKNSTIFVFQSTLPQGERHITSHANTSGNRFQSTLPQGERLNPSIGLPSISLFQSTLPQGERPLHDFNRAGRLLHFNPRSHKGSDTAAGTDNRDTKISIHAPTRGATLSSAKNSTIFVFQSTLPQGERHLLRFPAPKLKTFQSTLPQGERHQFTLHANFGIEFQSTLPQGERL